jgi:Zn-dependent protease
VRGSIRLGKLFGIPIGLHYSWFLIFAFFTISLSLHFHDTYNWSEPVIWLVGVATSLLLFGSVLTHELAHSLISRRNGVPVKSITLFIFGGVARIGRESNLPSAEFKMAIAGPLCSLTLAGLFALLWWPARHSIEPVAALAGWLAVINASLAVFNMIPGFPLDGGRVLRSIIWATTHSYRRATQIATRIGRGVAYLLIMVGVVLVLLGDWYSGLWLAFIGWFLDSAASTSNRQAMLRESLQGFAARDVMSKECPLIPSDLSLRQLVQMHVLPTGRRCFFVAEGDQLGGIMTMNDIKAVPESKWDSVTVDQAMTPAPKLQTAQPDEIALSVLDRMDEAEVNQMPVLENGRIVGVIVREELLRFIRTRAELGV